MLRHSFLHDLVVEARCLRPVVSFLHQPQVGVVEEFLRFFKRSSSAKRNDVVYVRWFYKVPITSVDVVERGKQMIPEFVFAESSNATHSVIRKMYRLVGVESASGGSSCF